MNGNELYRRLQKIGRERGVEVSFETERGKGSHGTVRFGDRYAVMKDRRCARRSWRDPAGESPAQVRGSARLVTSVAAWKATTRRSVHSDRLGCGIEPRNP